MEVVWDREIVDNWRCDVKKPGRDQWRVWFSPQVAGTGEVLDGSWVFSAVLDMKCEKMPRRPKCLCRTPVPKRHIQERAEPIARHLHMELSKAK